MDEQDSETILKKIYEQNNLNTRLLTFKQAKDSIRQYKTINEYINLLIDLDINKVKEMYEKENDINKKIIYGYLYEQRKCFGLDFSDLIYFTLYILTNFKEQREKWQKKLMYIMVDEFQDVNDSNYSLVNILSEYHKNLFIVGDPDQTIYSWRGAKVEYILNFDKYFENTKTIVLNKNYRSTREILNVSNSLISKTKQRIEKELKAMKKSNFPVVYNHAKTTVKEAEWIVEQIKRLQEEGKNLEQIAILYRAHFVSRAIEEAFIRNKIKYILYNGIEFYKRKEIKDILSYLRIVVFNDDLSFLRIINEPKRNIGKTRIAFLYNYAEKNKCLL